MDPSAQLAALHISLLRGDHHESQQPVTFPPAVSSRVDGSPPPRPAGLPAQLTSFVGRTEELRRLDGQLATARLVTITGPGGTGKTRAAVEAANRQPADTCFVDLSPVVDGGQVARTALRALGLRENTRLGGTVPAPDPVDRLVAALTNRPLLLVLDNCEHVLPDTARLARTLLAACPDLRILATSREPLGLTGEVLSPLPPLASPPAGTEPTEALTYPAVRLLADRVTAVRPDFTVDHTNVDTVRRICAALDGLPLAIELAAVRLRTLAPDAVAARLDDRFRLLNRGDRTAATRHQTLRAVIDWSWDLLDPDEQRLARRLTVFPAGATLDAVQQVTALTDGDTASDVADVLTALVDRSLVEWTGTRYRMLDSIRAYCAQRLAESGERDRVHRAHATYCLDLARTADPRLRQAGQVQWLARLAAEHSNLHAALTWAATAAPDLALRLVGALAWYWFLRGVRGETAPVIAGLVAHHAGQPPPDLVEEHLLCELLDLTTTPDVHDPARLRRIEAAAAGIGRPARQPLLVVLLAQLGGPPAAEVSARLQLLADDPWSQGLLRFGNGYLHLFDDRLDQAHHDLTVGAEQFRATGDRWGRSQTLDALAAVADRQGDTPTALALSDEALALVEQLGALEELTELRCRRAERLLRAGDVTAARTEYAHATDLVSRTGTPGTLALSRYGLAELARREGDLLDARRRAEEALAACPADWGSLELRSRILTTLGRTTDADGASRHNSGGEQRTSTEALPHHRAALAAALAFGKGSCVAEAVDGLAGAALRDGNPHRAAYLLGMATALRGPYPLPDPDRQRTESDARTRLGDHVYQHVHDDAANLDRADILAHLHTLTAG